MLDHKFLSCAKRQPNGIALAAGTRSKMLLVEMTFWASERAIEDDSSRPLDALLGGLFIEPITK
jgi:hypothetical protein